MKKDSATIKVLAELGLHDRQLNDEQEQILKRAVDPDEEFLQKAKELLTQQDDNSNVTKARKTRMNKKLRAKANNPAASETPEQPGGATDNFNARG